MFFPSPHSSRFFLIFVVISVISFASFPIIKSTLNDISDIYVRSQIKIIQSEIILFSLQGKETFPRNFCFEGIIRNHIQNLINEHKELVVCRLNQKNRKEIIVYTQLKNGFYYAVDTNGFLCQRKEEPKSFSC